MRAFQSCLTLLGPNVEGLWFRLEKMSRKNFKKAIEFGSLEPIQGPTLNIVWQLGQMCICFIKTSHLSKGRPLASLIRQLIELCI